MRLPVLALLALVASMPASARAGGLNIDFGSGAGVPSNLHGGPARQPGTWNVVTGLEPVPIELFDVEGMPTHATVEFSLPFGPATFDHPATTGDTGALLDDYLDLHSVPATLEIHGLDRGSYTITVIAWAPDEPAYKTSVSLDGRHATWVGGDWPGGYREGVTHVTLRAHVRDGEPLTIRLFGLGHGTLNGLQVSSRR